MTAILEAYLMEQVRELNRQIARRDRLLCRVLRWWRWKEGQKYAESMNDLCDDIRSEIGGQPCDAA